MDASKVRKFAVLKPKFNCKAPDCKNDTFNRKDLHFFPFPDDKERCQVWLALSGRHDLMNADSQHFNKFNKLCAEHFEADQFEDLDRSILIDTAVPTIFGFSEAPDMMETEGTQGEVSEYIPECVDIEEQAVIDLPDDSIASTEGDDVMENLTEKPSKEDIKVITLKEDLKVNNTPAMATYSAQRPPRKQQLQTRTITTTVGGQKRILMAVPKEMYMSAVKSGKIPFAKSIDLDANKLKTNIKIETSSTPSTATTMSTPSVTNITSNSASVDASPMSLLRKRVAEQQEKVEVAKKKKLPKYHPPLIPLPRISPPLPEEPRVYQVAPELPVQAQPVTVANFLWSSLLPEGWQDWPVPTDVFLASAVQLKNNYLKLFPKGDRVDIETTLHLASNYKNLSNESRAHVRARIHHYLKLLQLEKSKLKIVGENNEN